MLRDRVKLKYQNQDLKKKQEPKTKNKPVSVKKKSSRPLAKSIDTTPVLKQSAQKPAKKK